MQIPHSLQVLMAAAPAAAPDARSQLPAPLAMPAAYCMTPFAIGTLRPLELCDKTNSFP